MAYTKIHLKKQNKDIFICNETNRQFNDKGYLVTNLNRIYPALHDINSENPKTDWRSRKKNNSPKRIRVILGHACNYSCSYCTQKDIGNPTEKEKNSNLSNFILSFDEHIDRSNLERVELWGGEPFLYWKDMVQLMRFFDKENIVFYISTNGSTLMEKHIEFFQELKGTVSITISHDGPGQEALRGEEIFNTPRVQKIIKMIDDLYPKISYSFNSVITNTNYDLFAINHFFDDVATKLELKHTCIGLEIGRTYENIIDEDNHYSFSYDNVIHGENLEKFSVILKKFYSKHIEQQKKVLEGNTEEKQLLPCWNFLDDRAIATVLGYTKYSLIDQWPNQSTNCGVDWEYALDVDLNGNIRTCQNVDSSHISGNINSLQEVNLFAIDLNRTEKEGCKSCPVRLLCNSGCPIVMPEKTFNRNCSIEKVWYKEHLLAGLSIIFDDDVSIVEEGIIWDYTN